MLGRRLLFPTNLLKQRSNQLPLSVVSLSSEGKLNTTDLTGLLASLLSPSPSMFRYALLPPSMCDELSPEKLDVWWKKGYLRPVLAGQLLIESLLLSFIEEQATHSAALPKEERQKRVLNWIDSTALVLKKEKHGEAMAHRFRERMHMLMPENVIVVAYETPDGRSCLNFLSDPRSIPFLLKQIQEDHPDNVEIRALSPAQAGALSVAHARGLFGALKMHQWIEVIETLSQFPQNASSHQLSHALETLKREVQIPSDFKQAQQIEQHAFMAAQGLRPLDVLRLTSEISETLGHTVENAPEEEKQADTDVTAKEKETMTAPRGYRNFKEKNMKKQTTNIGTFQNPKSAKKSNKPVVDRVALNQKIETLRSQFQDPTTHYEALSASWNALDKELKAAELDHNTYNRYLTEFHGLLKAKKTRPLLEGEVSEILEEFKVLDEELGGLDLRHSSQDLMTTETRVAEIKVRVEQVRGIEQLWDAPRAAQQRGFGQMLQRIDDKIAVLEQKISEEKMKIEKVVHTASEQVNRHLESMPEVKTINDALNNMIDVFEKLGLTDAKTAELAQKLLTMPQSVALLENGAGTQALTTTNPKALRAFVRSHVSSDVALTEAVVSLVEKLVLMTQEPESFCLALVEAHPEGVRVTEVDLRELNLENIQNLLASTVPGTPKMMTLVPRVALGQYHALMRNATGQLDAPKTMQLIEALARPAVSASSMRALLSKVGYQGDLSSLALVSRQKPGAARRLTAAVSLDMSKLLRHLLTLGVSLNNRDLLKNPIALPGRTPGLAIGMGSPIRQEEPMQSSMGQIKWRLASPEKEVMEHSLGMGGSIRQGKPMQSIKSRLASPEEKVMAHPLQKNKKDHSDLSGLNDDLKKMKTLLKKVDDIRVELGQKHARKEHLEALSKFSILIGIHVEQLEEKHEFQKLKPKDIEELKGRIVREMQIVEKALHSEPFWKQLRPIFNAIIKVVNHMLKLCGVKKGLNFLENKSLAAWNEKVKPEADKLKDDTKEPPKGP